MHQAIGLNIASCKPVGGGDLPKTEDVIRRQYGKVSIITDVTIAATVHLTACDINRSNTAVSGRCLHSGMMYNS